MRGKEPAEHIWGELKRAAAGERGTVSIDQAAKRVRSIVASEGVETLPDAALRFYAAEYVRMVAERN